MIKQLSRKSEIRPKRIRELLETPCFQQCGICPADVGLLRKAANIDVSNPHVGVTEPNMQFPGGVGEQTIVAGDVTYSKIYSDGSCREGNIRSVARAGWGVFVAPSSPHNFHAPLDGPVQTSYRAELKAVLHILRHTVTPTMIMCDCQSVVNTLTRLLEDGIIPANVQEQDLLGPNYGAHA